jgi:hypothetical protein
MLHETPSAPRFGFRYIVGAAVCFDPPHETLDDLFALHLASLERVDDLLDALRRVHTGGSPPIDRRLDSWTCALGTDHVTVTSSGGSAPVDVPTATFVRIVEQWRDHLANAPHGLERVATEAAVALRRIAAMSWLDSAVAVAAGIGWSREAAHLASIGRSIADGSVEQVVAMRNASESWHQLRPMLTRRTQRISQFDSVVAALDHLFGTN